MKKKNLKKYLGIEVLNHQEYREGIVIEFPMNDDDRLVLTEYQTNQYGEPESHRLGEEWIMFLEGSEMKKVLKQIIRFFKKDPELHIFIDEDVVTYVESGHLEKRLISLEELSEAADEINADDESAV